MTLPGVALVDDDVGGLDTICKTHIDIPLYQVTFRQIHFHCKIRNENLLPRKSFNRSLRYLVVSDGT